MTTIEAKVRLAQRTLDFLNDEDLNPAFLIIKESGVSRAQAFVDAHHQVLPLLNKMTEEKQEKQQALTELERIYDIARAAIMAGLPHVQVASPAGSMNTPDDLMEAAEALENVLLEQEGEWVPHLLNPLQSANDACAKEWHEWLDANREVQDAQRTRRDALALFEAMSIDLRRLVRSVLGSSSKTYQLLSLR